MFVTLSDYWSDYHGGLSLCFEKQIHFPPALLAKLEAHAKAAADNLEGAQATAEMKNLMVNYILGGPRYW